MVIQQRPSSFSDRPQVSSMVKSRRRSVSPAEPPYRLAQALVEQEKWQEAIAAYQQALTITPNWVEVQRELGDLFLKLERWDEAVEVYETAIGLRSDVAEVYHNLGEALLKLQRWEDAIAAYQKAIELNPEFSWSYNNLGDGLRELQRWNKAASAYQKAIELKPDFALSHHNLGDILAKKEEWEGAIAAYQKATDLDPNFVWSYYNLAEIYVKLDQWDEAVEAYRQVLKIKPDLTEVEEKLNRALHQQVKTRLETALSYYRKAIKNDPTDVESYQKALEIKPDDPDLYLGLGNAWIAKGEVEKAIALYQSAIRINPGLSEAKFKLEQLIKQTTSQKPLTSFDQEQIKEEALTTNIAQVTSDITVNIQTTDVRLIAFYLPQYHPIPENDEWWGKGFTEWTNVTKAQPLFEGHYQPKLPADLGFYDLRVPEVRDAQARLAKKYGIYGFCYYYYWFAGKRLLHAPLDEVLVSKKPDFPFCLCWANENWTRRWDGSESEILIAQEHSFENNQAFAESLVPFMKDERYIRVNGKPLVLIYRANILPDIEETVKLWREVWRENDVGEVYLCGCLSFDQQASQIISWGLDAGVQFPPHGMGTKMIEPATLGCYDFEGQIYEFNPVVENSLRSKFPSEKEFLSVITSWDNTARRGKKGYMFLNTKPEIYELWLRGVIEKTQQLYSGDERLVFINAWNEWAEGTYLEPDVKYGHGYLSATSKALNGAYSLQTAIGLLRYLPIQTQEHLNYLINELEFRVKVLQRSIELLINEVEINQSKIVYSLLIKNISLKNQDQNNIYFDDPPINTEFKQDKYLSISGWCFNNFGKKVKKIQICKPGHIVLANIPIENDRPDIGQVFPECKQLDVGFADRIKAEDLLVVDKKDYKLEIYSFLENDEAIESAVIDISVKKEEFQRKLSGKIKTKIKWYYHQKKAVNGIIIELRNGKISTKIDFECLLYELEEIVAQWQTMSSNLSGYLTSKNE